MANTSFGVLTGRRETSDGGVVTVVAGSFEALVRRGLASVLAEDTSVRVLDSNLEGTNLEHTVMELAPQVAILDEASISLARRLMALQPAIGVLVLAREPTFTYGMVLLAAGLSCVAGSASEADIVTSLHIVGQGGCRFVSADGRRVRRPDREAEGILTKRESQVLGGLSENESYAEIALKLKISAATVKKHTASLLRKLGASSKRALVGMPILWDQSRCSVEGASSTATSASS
jgi:DNA-binding NarL/FixJ family response regulator